MKYLHVLLFSLVAFAGLNSQAYQFGDQVDDFKLMNVDGKWVSLSDYKDSKAYIIVFTCNHCPYAKMYEDRIIKLASAYKAKGIPVIAINPNDPDVVPEDSYELMVTQAKSKSYTFPYLFDEKQTVYPKFGATRTPQVYVLDAMKKLRYSGAIDDSPKDATMVQSRYLENAVSAVESGKTPDPQLTKAIGCSIKKKS
ncbi:MAG: thioredoxin family protein [Saprospiraceae bacterium]|nr:thioredoxin family protein [Saprospiraceae bacterium]